MVVLIERYKKRSMLASAGALASIRCGRGCREKAGDGDGRYRAEGEGY